MRICVYVCANTVCFMEYYDLKKFPEIYHLEHSLLNRKYSDNLVLYWTVESWFFRKTQAYRAVLTHNTWPIVVFRSWDGRT